MWGITAATARRNGYVGAMSMMPRDTAATIDRNEYLVKPGFDLVHAVSPRIAEEMFILNALNRQGKDYPDIGVDGRIGPATIAALSAFLAKRGVDGETAILRALNCQQGVRYLDITEARQQNEDFISAGCSTAWRSLNGPDHNWPYPGVAIRARHN